MGLSIIDFIFFNSDKISLSSIESSPAKKIYSVTDKGLDLLSSWVKEIKERKKTFEFFLKRYGH